MATTKRLEGIHVVPFDMNGCACAGGNLTYGMCLPAACTLPDLTNSATHMYSYLISLIPLLVWVDFTTVVLTCGNGAPSGWSIAALSTLSVLLVVTILLAVGTLLDMIDRGKFGGVDAAMKATTTTRPLSVPDTPASAPGKQVDTSQDYMYMSPPTTASTPMYVPSNMLQNAIIPTSIVPPAVTGSLNSPAAAWPTSPHSDLNGASLTSSAPIAIPAGRKLRMRTSHASGAESLPIGSPLSPHAGAYPMGSYQPNVPMSGVPTPSSSFVPSTPGIMMTAWRPNRVDDEVPVPPAAGRPAPIPSTRAYDPQPAPMAMTSPSLRSVPSALPGFNRPSAAKPRAREDSAPAGSGLRAALKCFSVLTNVGQLMSTDNRRGAKELAPIDGIRSVSMGWIILGHVVVFMGAVGFINLGPLSGSTEVLSSWTFQAIPGAEFAVDTFLVLSGFLAAHGLLRHARGSGASKLSVRQMLLYILHRVIRILPAYAIVLAVYATMFPLFSEGPFWFLTSMTTGQCSNWWWTNLLFVNNLVPWNNNFLQECMGWTYYLALDMQLYIFVPLFVLVYLAVPLASLLLVLVLILASLIASGVIVSKDNYSPIVDVTLNPSFAYNDVYVSKPWARAPSQLIGILVAFALDQIREIRDQQASAERIPENSLGIETFASLHVAKSQRKPFFTLSHTTQAVIETIALGLMACVVVGSLPAYSGSGSWDDQTNLAYTILSKPTWSLAIAMFIITTTSQRSNVTASFLGSGWWRPFARLTYSAFLVRPIVLQFFLFSTTQYYRYSGILVSGWFVAVLAVSYSLAAILYVGIERPFANLEALAMQALRAACSECQKRRRLTAETELDTSTLGTSLLPKGKSITFMRDDTLGRDDAPM